MKKYKVNGKVVVADSLREAIVKYRKLRDAEYYTADRETGTFIDKFSTIAEAKRAIQKYEAEDKRNGDYTPNFYAVVDKEHNTVDSVGDAQNYSAGQKFRDPKGRIWEVKSVNGDLLTIAVDGKEMSNKLHKEIFAEWAKTWDVADSVKDYDDEYFSVRYSRDGKDGIYASRILIKANSEAEARAKFDREMKGYKIASISRGVSEGAEELIRRGISVIDDSVEDSEAYDLIVQRGRAELYARGTLDKFAGMTPGYKPEYITRDVYLPSGKSVSIRYDKIEENDIVKLPNGKNGTVKEWFEVNNYYNKK